MNIDRRRDHSVPPERGDKYTKYSYLYIYDIAALKSANDRQSTRIRARQSRSYAAQCPVRRKQRIDGTADRHITSFFLLVSFSVIAQIPSHITTQSV